MAAVQMIRLHIPLRSTLPPIFAFIQGLPDLVYFPAQVLLTAGDPKSIHEKSSPTYRESGEKER